MAKILTFINKKYCHLMAGLNIIASAWGFITGDIVYGALFAGLAIMWICGIIMDSKKNQ